MEILLGLLLLAAVLAVLAYPLYQARPRAVWSGGSALSDLLAQRDGFYATLRDLDLDHELGKLDDADYQARREKYLSLAALVLKQLDALRGTNGGESRLSDEIEREVLALRQRPVSPTPPALTEYKPSRSPYPEGRGTRTRPVADALERSALACPNCGRAYNEGDRFCARCGHSLT